VIQVKIGGPGLEIYYYTMCSDAGNGIYKSEFRLKNTGTVALTVNLAYTKEYRNAGGAALVKDISLINLSEINIGTSAGSNDIGGYEDAAGNHANPVVIPGAGAPALMRPGDEWFGTCYFSGVSPESGESFHAIWIAEGFRLEEGKA
jgi:hypothetical protein